MDTWLGLVHRTIAGNRESKRGRVKVKRLYHEAFSGLHFFLLHWTWYTPTMEVSRPDFMGLISVSSLKGLGLVSVSRFTGLGLARDYSIETTRPEEKTNENRGMKKALGRW